MQLKKTTSIMLVGSLAISLFANVVLLNRTTTVKAEYTWIRNTYETDIIGAYKHDGWSTAYREHLEGNPKEYVLDSASPSMGIAIENFYSHKPDKTGNTDSLSWVRRVFDKSHEPERLWHIELKNRWLEAFVREHNATLSRLRSEKP